MASFNLPDRERKPGSIGIPVPGVEMKLVDGDGKEVPQGEVGEILIRGPVVMKSYWNREDATRGDEPALERTRAMLDPRTVAAAAQDRRMFERAFLHARRSVDDLSDVAAALSAVWANRNYTQISSKRFVISKRIPRCAMSF